MRILELIELKYPNIQGIVYWETQPDGTNWGSPIDGLVWENQEISKPTDQDLIAWESEYAEQLVFNSNKALNKPIYDELNRIDIKSIRALREGNTERINALELEASSLRAQLLPTV